MKEYIKFENKKGYLTIMDMSHISQVNIDSDHILIFDLNNKLSNEVIKLFKSTIKNITFYINNIHVTLEELKYGHGFRKNMYADEIMKWFLKE